MRNDLPDTTEMSGRTRMQNYKVQNEFITLTIVITFLYPQLLGKFFFLLLLPSFMLYTMPLSTFSQSMVYKLPPTESPDVLTASPLVLIENSNL